MKVGLLVPVLCVCSPVFTGVIRDEGRMDGWKEWGFGTGRECYTESTITTNKLDRNPGKAQMSNEPVGHAPPQT